MTPAGARCLVTGADGYIGRHLASTLRIAGHAVTEAWLAGAPEGARNWNIADPGQIPTDLGDFDALYWMAGLTGTSTSFDQAEAFIRVNVTSLTYLLNTLRGLGRPPRLLFPSTRLVYKGQAGLALREDAPKEPLTPYAVTKLAGESLLDMYARRFGVPYTVVRICVPYGSMLPGSGSYGTLRHFLEPAQAGRPISIFGDGSQRRSLIHVADLARLLGECGLHPATRNGIFNLGGPDNLSVREIAVKIATAYGVPVAVVPWPEDALKLESGDTVFDESKLAAVLPLTYSERFDGYVASLH